MIDVDTILDEVAREYHRANAKFPPFNSAHEGYAVLLEEVDELWDTIKRNEPKERRRAEAIQVAAMAVKLIELDD